MFWNDDTKAIIKNLNTNIEKGLKEETAKELLKVKGLNQLPTTKKKPLWKIVAAHLIEPFMFVLFALLVVVSVLQQWSEVVVIFLIIFIETSLSTYQEMKAAYSLDALRKLVQQHAVVIRDGKKYNIDVQNLVVGDLIYLEAGMFIPADVRIVQSSNLRIDESLLTGESIPITKTIEPINKKQLAIADRTNMGFMSTIVSAGSGQAIVVATGIETEIGKINKLLQEEKEPKSPLSKQIVFLIRAVSVIALILGIGVFLIQYFLLSSSTIESLVFVIALVIAVVPEGLLVIITVALSLGSRRMAKKNAIVKKLNAVETLGQVNVICSDKTGTLTENKMTVKKFYLNEEISDATDFKYKTWQEQLFLDSLILANNSQVEKDKIVGDPTETALLIWAQTLDIAPSTVQKMFKRIHELPFDSNRKLMSTINYYEEKKEHLFIKGAPDTLIKRCNYLLIGKEKIKMTDKIKSDIIKKIQLMTDEALRVLGSAYKEVNPKNDYNNFDSMENDLIFLGLVGMIDPPRKEVRDVLVKTKLAGINTRMITGDHINTAVAIGKELNILQHKNQAINGDVIEDLSQEQLEKDINNYQVFARVSPEHKVRIVKALQTQGNIVSMTGDGVNDAPSLRAANIGVAMGITGTDVAKEASQMVLTDDNFGTIVDAIEEGRNIYNKLKRIIAFILITNFSQVVAIILGAAFQVGDLLTPLQILWINLIVESILAITMSMGPNNPKLMSEKPISKKDNVLNGSWIFIIGTSIILGVLLVITAIYLPKVLHFKPFAGFIYVFVIMVNAPVFYSISFSLGRNTSLFNKLIFKNRIFLMSVLLSFALNCIIIFTPGINKAFDITEEISFVSWIYCLLIALVPTVVLELYKFIKRTIVKFTNKN